MTQTYTATDVLMGGGGAPSFKFADPGTRLIGTIVSPPGVHQEKDYDKNNPGGGPGKLYPSGDPIMGLTVEIQTGERDPSIDDDDGVRTFWIEGRYLKADVRAAVKTAGCSGLEVGGHLDVTFTHREDPTDKRSRKFWNVSYTSAANAGLMREAPNAASTAAPTPAPAATPAPAPAGASPVATAKELITAGLNNDDIAAATGLPITAIIALRNTTAPY